MLPHEAFVHCFTRDHDGETFVNDKAKALNESIKEIMSQPENDPVESYIEATRGVKNGQVYGLGSMAEVYVTTGYTTYSLYSGHKNALQQKVDDQAKQIEQMTGNYVKLIEQNRQIMEMLKMFAPLQPPVTHSTLPGSLDPQYPF